MQLEQISLTIFFFFFSLSSIFASIIHHCRQLFQTTSCVHEELLLVSSCWPAKNYTTMKRVTKENVLYEFILASQPTITQQWKGLHKRMSFINSFFLLQPCPAYLVCLTWMVLEIGNKWLYCSCFVGCCFQDLFNIAHNILVQFPTCFLSICFVSIYLSCIYTATAWKKSQFFYHIDQTTT